MNRVKRVPYDQIPQPPLKPVLGNLPDLRSDEVVIARMMELAQQHGPISTLQFPRHANPPAARPRDLATPMVMVGPGTEAATTRRKPGWSS